MSGRGEWRWGQPRSPHDEPERDVDAEIAFHLDARTASSIQMADGFALKAKDVVFVDPVPLVVFSRVANLVLVSANTATAIRALPKIGRAHV